MTKKPVTPQTISRIRQWDDELEEWDSLDELAQDERIRKQPRDTRQQPSGIKQQRKQRDKQWGRTINRSLRQQRKNGHNKP